MSSREENRAKWEEIIRRAPYTPLTLAYMAGEMPSMSYLNGEKLIVTFKKKSHPDYAKLRKEIYSK